MSTRTTMLNALKSGMFQWTNERLKRNVAGETCHCAFGALLEALEVPSQPEEFDVLNGWSFLYRRREHLGFPPMELAPPDIREAIMTLNDQSPTNSYAEVIDFLENTKDWD